MCYAFELALEMWVFEERGKPEYRGENLSEQRKEPTTNLAHIWSVLRIEPGPHRCASPAPRDAVVLCRCGSKPQEFGVKRVDEEQIIIVTRIQSWHFERWPFVRAKNI